MRTSAIGVPTALGLSPNPQQPDRPRGTWRAPQALISSGLLDRLGIHGADIVPVARYAFDRDPASGIYNRVGVARQTLALADSVGRVLDRGERALVLGGDCSVLLGPALALRRRERTGLVFIDGHLDFRHLGNTPRLRAAAGEDLAIVTGRGLDEHADIDGLRPYFRDHDVAALGEREHNATTADITHTDIRVVPIEDVQGRDPKALAREVVAHMANGRKEYWLHLDVDVLNSDLMPAVDSPQPGGLLRDELVALLHELWSTPGARGLDVTIYDPELDLDGTLTEFLSALLEDALTPDR